MRLVRLGAAVLNQTPLDWVGNRERILEAIKKAKEEGISLLCLPELCVTGYGCEDMFFSPALQEMALDSLFEIAGQTKGIAVCVGVPLYHRNSLYNTVAFIADGEVLGFVAKRHLAGDGVHYEPRWFKPWPRRVVDCFKRGEQTYPLGDLVFDLGGVRVGFEICEDAWGAHRPGVDLAESAVDIILNPSASHFSFGKYEVRKRFVLEGSRAFGVAYVYANLNGNESGRLIYDGGALIASEGAFAAIGPRFSFCDVHLISAVVDLWQVRMQRARIAATPSAVGVERDSSLVTCRHKLPEASLDSLPFTDAQWERSEHLRFEEFVRASALGLFDYLQKSKAKGFVLSLSGGADSTTIAVLVQLMIRLSLAELGGEEFSSRLGLQKLGVGDEFGVNVLTKRLLCCVYQATSNSSATTYQAAKTVAEALGAEFHRFEVDSLVCQYTELVEKALGRPLTWEGDDIALQNIQARVRAPGVWFMANLKQALLLATSNRSEVAVGYATMDGDTAGSIAPLSGIDKDFIRSWLRWMEGTGPLSIGPYSFLSEVNKLAPTAELRPENKAQTDEADLMPYPVLNFIEGLAVRDKLSPLEVLTQLKHRYPAEESEQLVQWIKRFFHLWSKSQWKRERLAPGFHFDDRNLDPRSWCRFPILSGEFAPELLDIE